eukprot:GILJ01008673.1.p1 GENE.GILJ01008673.1~~GILJ01008673.1.p1  ORF type:complete len:962 (-),score=207.50 GILJ01008673.1:196-3081(-)
MSTEVGLEAEAMEEEDTSDDEEETEGDVRQAAVESSKEKIEEEEGLEAQGEAEEEEETKLPPQIQTEKKNNHTDIGDQAVTPITGTKQPLRHNNVSIPRLVLPAHIFVDPSSEPPQHAKEDDIQLVTAQIACAQDAGIDSTDRLTYELTDHDLGHAEVSCDRREPTFEPAAPMALFSIGDSSMGSDFDPFSPSRPLPLSSRVLEPYTESHTESVRESQTEIHVATNGEIGVQSILQVLNQLNSAAFNEPILHDQQESYFFDSTHQIDMNRSLSAYSSGSRESEKCFRETREPYFMPDPTPDGIHVRHAVSTNIQSDHASGQDVIQQISMLLSPSREPAAQVNPISPIRLNDPRKAVLNESVSSWLDDVFGEEAGSKLSSPFLQPSLTNIDYPISQQQQKTDQESSSNLFQQFNDSTQPFVAHNDHDETSSTVVNQNHLMNRFEYESSNDVQVDQLFLPTFSAPADDMLFATAANSNDPVETSFQISDSSDINSEPSPSRLDLNVQNPSEHVQSIEPIQSDMLQNRSLPLTHTSDIDRVDRFTVKSNEATVECAQPSSVHNAVQLQAAESDVIKVQNLVTRNNKIVSNERIESPLRSSSIQLDPVSVTSQLNIDSSVEQMLLQQCAELQKRNSELQSTVTRLECDVDILSKENGELKSQMSSCIYELDISNREKESLSEQITHLQNELEEKEREQQQLSDWSDSLRSASNLAFISNLQQLNQESVQEPVQTKPSLSDAAQPQLVRAGSNLGSLLNLSANISAFRADLISLRLDTESFINQFESELIQSFQELESALHEQQQKQLAGSQTVPKDVTTHLSAESNQAESVHSFPNISSTATIQLSMSFDAERFYQRLLSKLAEMHLEMCSLVNKCQLQNQTNHRQDVRLRWMAKEKKRTEEMNQQLNQELLQVRNELDELNRELSQQILLFQDEKHKYEVETQRLARVIMNRQSNCAVCSAVRG